MPDGRKIQIGKERFQSAEILFQPGLADHDQDGLHKYCFDCVMKCDNELRRDLFANIVLSGGNTLFETLGDRLQSEVQ